MADITTASKPGKPGVRKSQQKQARVDLTPMVDLGFLLITFFIFTTTLSSSKAMQLNLPKNSHIRTPSAESATLTIIPINEKQVAWYAGQFSDAMAAKSFGITGYDQLTGIGNIIRQKQASLDQHARFTREDLMIIIKPTENAVFKNTIDMLDEMLLNDVERHAMADLTPEEKAWIAKETASGAMQ